MIPLQRHVKYEAELDKAFADRVAAFPGGERLWDCIQCGTCSAICPLSVWMDYTPRRLIAMIRAGFREEVLHSRTIWVCSSCYACTVLCPREIRITEIMYALKRIAIEEGIHPPRFPIPILAQEFTRMVEKHGRITESWLMFRVLRRAVPLELWKRIPLGLRLFRAGRMPLRMEHVKAPQILRRLLHKVREAAA